ncbi:MAG: hypothetical protein KBD23_05660 [Gammaproteobacteria bacterium]|nr:hypothetical protein [Gammaproteobacteria bacterium]MBP9729600.1 hypothetical protein [Gammaproteobacteria bacterium]
MRIMRTYKAKKPHVSLKVIQQMKDFQSAHNIELALDWKMLRDEGRRYGKIASS